MNRVVIGIGSNIRPAQNIARAIERIAERQRLVAQSRFIETEPIGDRDQPHFVNGVILIETEMPCAELKRWLGAIEKELGRVRTANRYGPRTIDLDIVVWNGEIVDADVYERDFLQSAVVEVLPELNSECDEGRTG